MSGGPVGLMGAPPFISTGLPGITVPSGIVKVVPAPTSDDVPVLVSLLLKVMFVGVTTTLPLPPKFRISDVTKSGDSTTLDSNRTVANDGIAIKRMRPKPDPIKLNRVIDFIGSSCLSSPVTQVFPYAVILVRLTTIFSQTKLNLTTFRKTT